MIKVFFRRIHLYMGLAAGLVIMVSCATGALLVFEEELQHATHHDRYYVAPGAKRVPLEVLAANLKGKVPAANITGYKVYTNPERSAEIIYTPKKEKGADKAGAAKGAKKGPGEGEGALRAFMNPYTGAIIECYDHKQSFFYKVMALHRWLLGGATGKLITGISTLIFLFILFTGIILWWPATKVILKQRLKVKWNASGKRLNHDLHVVLGFYASILLFVFSFTALAWSFQWFNDGIYKVTGSTKERPKAPNSTPSGGLPAGMQTALNTARTVYPHAVFYQLNVPKDTAGTVTATVLGIRAAHETATDLIYIDQYTGAVKGQFAYKDRNMGMKVRATFRPVHVGSVWGLPSKVLALLACLIGTALPVTGVILWINRTRKKKAPARMKLAAVPIGE